MYDLVVSYHAPTPHLQGMQRATYGYSYYSLSTSCGFPIHRTNIAVEQYLSHVTVYVARKLFFFFCNYRNVRGEAQKHSW